MQLQKIRGVSSGAGNLFFSLILQPEDGCEYRVSVMADNVVALGLKECVRQDAEPIAAIYRNLGTASAEQVVTRELAELALTMAGLAQQVRAHQMRDVARQLRQLQRMAESLGMVSLGLVAADVRVCVERADVTAFSAVWARLLRIAERSLAPDKDLLDQTFS